MFEQRKCLEHNALAVRGKETSEKLMDVFCSLGEQQRFVFGNVYGRKKHSRSKVNKLKVG